MTPWVAAGLFGFALALPMLAGPRLERDASPAQILAFSLSSLSALALGLVVSLVAVVDAADVPAGQVPGLVGRCVEAVTQLFAHPLGHWPRIAAAVVLLFVLGRLGFALLATCHSARYEVRSIARLVGARAWSERGGIVVVPGERPVAFTAGFVRPRIVVSSGLLRSLGAPQRRAVIEHERRHATGRDVWMLLIARVVARALPFVPSVRRATDQLILALELRADRSAARSVGDPLIVAEALLALAPGGSGAGRGATLGAAQAGIGPRVRRLLADAADRDGGRSATLAVCVAIGLVLAFVLLLVPGGVAWARGQGGTSHAICHLPDASLSSGTEAPSRGHVRAARSPARPRPR